MPRFAVLVTYREVFGKEPEVRDLHAILKKYQRDEVITFLGKLNCLLGTWRNEPQKGLDEKLANYMLSGCRDRLDRGRQGPIVRIVFSRLTLLYLIKQACFVSPDDGSNLVSDEGRNDIGVCCLMANDLVLPFAPSWRPSRSWCRFWISLVLAKGGRKYALSRPTKIGLAIAIFLARTDLESNRRPGSRAGSSHVTWPCEVWTCPVLSFGHG